VSHGFYATHFLSVICTLTLAKQTKLEARYIISKFMAMGRHKHLKVNNFIHVSTHQVTITHTNQQTFPRAIPASNQESPRSTCRPVCRRCFTTSTQFQPRGISPLSSCRTICRRFCAFVRCSFFSFCRLVTVHVGGPPCNSAAGASGCHTEKQYLHYHSR